MEFKNFVRVLLKNLKYHFHIAQVKQFFHQTLAGFFRL
jgi:hypothetical protein